MAEIMDVSRYQGTIDWASFKELINDNMPLDKKTTMNIIDLEGQNIMNILAQIGNCVPFQ